MENNTVLRILSSAVMLLAVLAVFVLGSVAFYIALLVIALVSYAELSKMTLQKSFAFKALITLAILLPNSAIIYIYESNGKVLLWMMLSIWANDIGAYLVGKNFGGPKLWAKISPNKTWTGFIGGILSAIVVGTIFLYLSKVKNCFSYLIFTPFLPIIATLGDLFESAIKRRCNVKDSGNIIPGHGGVLDRVDSFIFAAPFVAWLVFILQ